LQSIQVNQTEIKISFAIASAQILGALNSSTVLQPNSIKWDLRVTNFQYTNASTDLAVETLIRSKDKITRVNRYPANRTEIEIPHNRTVPANRTQISIGNGKGRIGFVNRTEIEDDRGNKSNGTVLVSAPIPVTEAEDLDAAEAAERKERGDDNDDDDKVETAGLRASNNTRVKVIFSFQTVRGTQGKVLFWDPENYVADVSEADSFSATDVEDAITGGLDAIFAPSDLSPSSSGSPSAGTTQPKGSDASRVSGSAQMVLVVAGAMAFFALL
jgi:hypothetical protein